MRRLWLLVVLLVLAGGGGYWFWQARATREALPPGIALANGRIEAEQVDIASKIAGRLVELNVKEGDVVAEGQVIARLDAALAEAQLRTAEAQLNEAEHAVEATAADIARAKAARELAQQEMTRATELSRRGFYPTEGVDQRRANLASAEAGLLAAEATLRRAQASVEAARAVVAQQRTALRDTVLTAPRAGRVLYRLAQNGEVLAAGGRVATLLDLTDVSMVVYLPAPVAGRLAYGAPARLKLDPAPDYVVPAAVSFVAPEAQFTPRQVETQSERETLMFRVKLRIAPELLKVHEQRVKSGVRGTAYIGTGEDVAWPAWLEVRLP